MRLDTNVAVELEMGEGNSLLAQLRMKKAGAAGAAGAAGTAGAASAPNAQLSPEAEGGGEAVDMEQAAEGGGSEGADDNVNAEEELDGDGMYEAYSADEGSPAPPSLPSPTESTSAASNGPNDNNASNASNVSNVDSGADDTTLPADPATEGKAEAVHNAPTASSAAVPRAGEETSAETKEDETGGGGDLYGEARSVQCVKCAVSEATVTATTATPRIGSSLFVFFKKMSHHVALLAFFSFYYYPFFAAFFAMPSLLCLFFQAFFSKPSFLCLLREKENSACAVRLPSFRFTTTTPTPSLLLTYNVCMEC